MQRLQKTFWVGGILGLCLGLSAAAQAQVIYVQSSNFRTVPVTQSFVLTPTIVSPRFSYGISYSYGSNYGYGYSNGLAWNNRRSGPAKYSETTYLPASSHADTGIASQSYVVSQPVVSGGVISSRSFVATQPVFVTRPVTAYRSVVSSQPIVISQPVRVYRSVTITPQNIGAEAACPTTKRLESSDPKVSVTESSDGRRTKTYRYEYELDHRPGRVTIEFDSKD